MFKKLLTASLFVFAFMVFSNSQGYSQTMYFCEGVDDDGYAISSSSVFNISPDGGYLYILVRSPYEIGCNTVKYVIYRNGEYDNTIYLDTEKNWVWFWKQVTFYKSGDYDVYAYDCYDNLLTSGNVAINYR